MGHVCTEVPVSGAGRPGPVGPFTPSPHPSQRSAQPRTEADGGCCSQSVGFFSQSKGRKVTAKGLRGVAGSLVNCCWESSVADGG